MDRDKPSSTSAQVCARQAVFLGQDSVVILTSNASWAQTITGIVITAIEAHTDSRTITPAYTCPSSVI